MSYKVISEPDKLINLISQYETIDHAHEIQAARVDDNELKKYWLWISDFWPGRNMGDSKVSYFLADQPFNLIFKHASTAIPEISKNGFYKCNRDEMEELMLPSNSLEVRASDMDYTKTNDPYIYFIINTHKPFSLAPANLSMAMRVHGRTVEQYTKTMELLKSNGINNVSNTMIVSLNPQYILDNTKPGESIAGVSALNDFLSGSIFDANLRFVDSYGRRLRGVSLEARSAEAPKMDEYDNALKLITGNLDEASLRINKNPAYATALNALVGSCLKSKA